MRIWIDTRLTLYKLKERLTVSLAEYIHSQVDIDCNARYPDLLHCEKCAAETFHPSSNDSSSLPWYVLSPCDITLRCKHPELSTLGQLGVQQLVHRAAVRMGVPRCRTLCHR